MKGRGPTTFSSHRSWSYGKFGIPVFPPTMHPTQSLPHVQKESQLAHQKFGKPVKQNRRDATLGLGSRFFRMFRVRTGKTWHLLIFELRLYVEDRLSAYPCQFEWVMRSFRLLRRLTNCGHSHCTMACWIELIFLTVSTSSCHRPFEIWRIIWLPSSRI